MNFENKIKIFATGEWNQKIKTAQELLELECEDSLVLALTDEDADIRYWSLKVLGEKNPLKYSGYAESMLVDDAWFVRCQAGQVIKDSMQKNSENLLKEFLKEEQDEKVIDFFKTSLQVK